MSFVKQGMSSFSNHLHSARCVRHSQLTPELHEVMDTATEQVVRPARGKVPNPGDLLSSKQERLILIVVATDRDKNQLREGNEPLSCCHCLIQPLRRFRFLPANHTEKLKAQRQVPLNGGDARERWQLSQVTNVHRPFDPIVPEQAPSDAVCVTRL